MTTAILAVQGAFIEHQHRLEQLGQTCIQLRQKSDFLQSFDRLVLPGGESTVQGKLLNDLNMLEPLRCCIEEGMPTLGTCAGLILLAQRIDGAGDVRGMSDIAALRTEVVQLGTLPVSVTRNAYGRQLGSFHTEAPFKGAGMVPMTFIRAPRIEQVGEGVEVLARVRNDIVAVRYQNQMGIAFHPELDSNNRIFELFLQM